MISLPYKSQRGAKGIMDTMREPDIREQIVEIGQLMYRRRLTDSAGGNISVQAAGRIFATPRYTGSKYGWHLTPDQVLAIDPDHIPPEQAGHISREIRVHLAIYREFPLAIAVIHAHPRYVMPFATLGKPIPPIWEGTQKFGTIGLVPELPAHSPELAEAVVEELRPRADALTKHGIAVLIPKHGIVVAGRDLGDAYDTLERISGNAECILLCRLLEQRPRA